MNEIEEQEYLNEQPVEVESKPIIKSKTVWFNAIVAVLGVVEMNLSMVEATIPQEYYGYIFIGIASINTVLRIVTTQGVKV